MKYFCMPADFTRGTIDAYARLNRKYGESQVLETYGNVSVANIMASGRPVASIPQVDFEQLSDYVGYSRKKGFDFCYTINASYMQNQEFTSDGIKKIKGFLNKLEQAGVRCVIVALPSLMELIRESGYDFEIKASVISQINTANKAMAFKKMGVDRISLDESINRDFDSLKRIRDSFGNKVEVIVNSVCHQDCHYRMFHYNQISGDSVDFSNEVSSTYYKSRCAIRLCDDVSGFLKITWIRPEDLRYYTNIDIEYFKLQGRQTVLRGDPARTVEYYFKEEYDGELKDLLFMFAPADNFRLKIQNKSLDGFIKPFAEVNGFCAKDCTSCNYCENFARKVIDYDDTRNSLREVHDYLAANDPYKKIINANG
ncbi:MAG: U32 family peptidase [Verrucomicrobiota bacterium]